MRAIQIHSFGGRPDMKTPGLNGAVDLAGISVDRAS
jgi:hypothetical protein